MPIRPQYVNKAQLPNEGLYGELFLTADTDELFVGKGGAAALHQIQLGGNVGFISQFNPAADGVTDDTAAFQACAAAFNEIWLQPGKSYFIGTNLTLSVPIRFIGGAKIIVGSGFTVTLNGHVYAPTTSQAFVVGLPAKFNQTGIDNLHRANESPISNGGQWTIPTGFGGSNDGGTLVSNVWSPITNDKWSAAYWNPQGAITDQWASIEVGVTPPTQSQYIVVCRGSLVAQTYYYMLINGSNGQIGKSVNGTGTTFTTFTSTLSPGDVMTLVVQGTTLTAYVNGVQKAQTTDSSIASGLPGMGMFSHTVTTNTSILAFATGTPASAIVRGSVVVGSNTPTVYPEWFGAKGDYSFATGAGTDDTGPIQAAFTSISSSGLGQGLLIVGNGSPTYAGSVTFSAKTYLTTSTLTLQASNVRIQGAGDRNTVIALSNPNANIFNLTGASGTANTLAFTELKQFSLVRLMPYPSTVNCVGLNCAFGLWCLLEEVVCWDSLINFSVLQTVGHFDLHRCQSNYTTISPGANKIGFKAGGMTSSRWIDCVVSGANTGLSAVGSGADFYLEGFETAGCSTGMSFTGGWVDTIIVRPVLESASSGGIVVASSTTNIIQIFGGYHNSSPLVIGSGATGVLMYGGQFTGTNASGLIQVAGANNVISGCYLNNNGVSSGPLIVVTGSDNTIVGNVGTGTLANPFTIGVSLIGGVRNTIVGNNLSGHGTTGLSYDATSNNNVSTGNNVDTTSITTAKSDAGTGNTAGV